MLLPSRSSALGSTLEQWFDELDAVPDVVGEFEDTALLEAFGLGGAGLVPASLGAHCHVAFDSLGT